MGLDEELYAFGEALPELASGFLILPTAAGAIDRYSQGDLIMAIPLVLLDVLFCYAIYKGILRGDLFYRWTKRKDYPDPLKAVYNKIKSISH